ncbi:MAG: hypothetical protein MUQ27_15480, partial [Acidimicrobiia bacterium]|nr:hypothetical protein [Acidimicrobiia bacterium]
AALMGGQRRLTGACHTTHIMMPSRSWAEASVAGSFDAFVVVIEGTGVLGPPPISTSMIRGLRMSRCSKDTEQGKQMAED